LKQSSMIVAVVIVVLVVAGGVYAGLFLSGPGSGTSTASTRVVQVVAAENFWGSLVSQIGGTRVHMISIVTDPNRDPHEYASNAANAQAISNANLVIVNGAGYDTWALSIIAASNSPHQTVLNVQQLLGQPVDTNPHFWYSPYYVNDTVNAMYKDLVVIDPSGASYYKQQYSALNSSMGTYDARIHYIAHQFAGTKVASTEDIFVYLANATKLNLISPPEFMKAVAEGNDPPASSVAMFQRQLQNKSVVLLVYNQQTVTPLTDNVKALATQNLIPIVGVTETIQPPDAQFQAWFSAELLALQAALGK
jgi:zinc/manganese transport system substrate-binding protein